MVKNRDLTEQLPENLGSLLSNLATLIKEKGGYSLLVGGSVRDLILGQSPEELDMEVRGFSTEEIIQLLHPKISG
jgi:tRNA nucleotidyltransferase/poly(A) polymerase